MKYNENLTDKSDKYIWLEFFVIVVITFAIALYACSPSTMCANADSRTYIGTATSLVQGNGFKHPDTTDPSVFVQLKHFPPLYPIALAALLKLGFTGTNSAILLSAFGFSTTIGLLFLVVVNLRRSNLSVWVFPFLPTLSTALYYVFFRMMSETVFFPLLALSLICLSFYFETAKAKYFWISCFAAALLPVTRYIGVAAIASNCLVILLHAKDDMSEGKGEATTSNHYLFCHLSRIKRMVFVRQLWKAFLYGALASIPTLLWCLYMILNGGLRNAHVPSMLKQRLRETIETLYFYIAPFGWPFTIQAIVVACVVIAFICLILVALPSRKQQTDFFLNLYILPWLAFLLCYSALLMLMTYLTGEPWPFGFRILIPYQLVFFVIVSVLLPQAYKNLPKTLRYVFSFGFIAFMLFCLIRATTVIEKFHRGLA